MEEHREKIEFYGGMMEKMGMSPVSSRVYIYILFCQDPGVTFEELVDYFNVSKSAISNALKLLTSLKMADSKTIGGQRKRFFFVDFQNLFSSDNLTQNFKLMADMMEDIKKHRNMEDKFGKGLHSAALLYKMLIIEMPFVIERWKKTLEMEG